MDPEKPSVGPPTPEEEPGWKPGEAEPSENLERGPEIPEIEIPTFVKREQPAEPEAPERSPEKPKGRSRIEQLRKALRAGARGAKEGWQEKAAERKAKRGPEDQLRALGFSRREIGRMTPLQREEALLFETKEGYEGEKKQRDPIRGFMRKVMKVDPDKFDPIYRSIDNKTIQIDEKGEVKGAKIIDFNNYHDYLSYLKSLSEEDQNTIGRYWDLPAILAAKFWDRLGDEKDSLHQFQGVFNDLSNRILRGEEEDTFAAVLKERKEIPVKVVEEKLKAVPKKEKVPAAKGTRAERREERLERWEEMSYEERQEKYGRTFELRERRYQLDRMRVNLAELELELNQRKSLLGKALEKAKFWEKTEPLSEVEKRYSEASQKYEQARAEYIGARAWRMLKERQRMAEEEADTHQAGGFESVRKVWRWLGEQNLEKVLIKKGKQPTSKFGKIAARMVSLRTATSLGLLVGGSVYGLGTAAGVGLLATRRVLSGTSAAFGSYDLMRMVSEKRALALDEQEIQKMELPQLEQKMAEFEARARFSGEKLVRSHDYLALRKEYSRRIASASEKEKQIAEAIQRIDAKLRERAAGLTKEERRKKAYAVGIGAVIGSATWLKGLTELFEKEPEVREVVGGLTPEDIRDAVNKGLTIPPELLGEPVMPDTSAIEPPLPPEVLEAAEEVKVEVPTEAAPGVTEMAGQEAPAAAAEAAPAEAAVETTTEVKAEAVGVVKKGGSAWQAARELVGEGPGKITQEQFAEAWSSPHSIVELESGRTIHISELGLTHVGDRVIYVPATETVPVHFVVDDVGETLHVGSNEDLAAAFDAAGRPRPEWLNEALEAKLSEYPEVEIDIVGEPGRFEELMPVPQEVIEEAANGNLELAPEALTFDSSSAEFVTDSRGRIVNVILESRRTAVREQDIISLFKDPDLATMKVPGGMPAELARAQVNADARNIVLYRRLLQKLTEAGMADFNEAAFVKNRIRGLIEKDRIFFGDIYKPEVTR